MKQGLSALVVEMDFDLVRAFIYTGREGICIGMSGQIILSISG